MKELLGTELPEMLVKFEIHQFYYRLPESESLGVMSEYLLFPDSFMSRSLKVANIYDEIPTLLSLKTEVLLILSFKCQRIKEAPLSICSLMLT